VSGWVGCRRNASRRPDAKVFGEGGFGDRRWALQRNFYRESEWGSERFGRTEGVESEVPPAVEVVAQA